MSRIGKKPIAVPKGVTAKVLTGAVEVQGPKGKLKQPLPNGINFELTDGHLVAKRATEDPELGKFHGLARSLVANAVLGVTEGFKRELDIVGVGYRAEVKGKQVIFALGYSHPVVFDIPQGIDVAIDKQTHITVTGVDRQLVGQVAANIRRLREPDPYKQKGVRYTGEVLSGRTLVSASSVEPTMKGAFSNGVGGGNLKGASAVGKAIAERSLARGITRVVFDRSGFLYHGRIRAVADAARKAGLEF